MDFKKLLLLVGFLLIGIANSQATTAAEECQKRAMSAYDKGSSDSDKQQRGAAAASECFKEMESLLKRNDSNSSSFSSGVVGSIILLLATGGFLAYKLATKGDKPMTPREIGSLREQVRDLFKPYPSDLQSVRKYKETKLEEAEKMFASALSGDLPITGNIMKDAVPKTRQELESFRVSTGNLIDAAQKALDSNIKVRDSGSKILSQPPIDENDKEEIELRESIKEQLARANKKIEGYQRELTELRG